MSSICDLSPADKAWPLVLNDLDWFIAHGGGKKMYFDEVRFYSPCGSVKYRTSNLRARATERLALGHFPKRAAQQPRCCGGHPKRAWILHPPRPALRGSQRGRRRWYWLVRAHLFGRPGARIRHLQLLRPSEVPLRASNVLLALRCDHALGPSCFLGLLRMPCGSDTRRRTARRRCLALERDDDVVDDLPRR